MLIVEDEPDVADAYAIKLRDDYETRIAIGGEAALDEIDDSVDAVLLDRRMPDKHGDKVLSELREAGYDCPVIMATAVSPDLNILEMDFNDYLCKPITGATLSETLSQHVDTSDQRDPRLDEFFELRSKLNVLEGELSPHELHQSDEYQRLKECVDQLGSDLSESVNEFDTVVDTYDQIERSS